MDSKVPIVVDAAVLSQLPKSPAKSDICQRNFLRFTNLIHKNGILPAPLAGAGCGLLIPGY